MNILAIDTSCDETAAAVTHNRSVITNVIWSQAGAHAQFGGVMPSLAQRMHAERIEFVIHKALGKKHKDFKDIDAIAVTVGPGLSIALGVGIERAVALAKKHKLPIFPTNHLEAHILSPFANPKTKKITDKISDIPRLGLVISGGNTILIKINKIGSYDVLAETQDDALGEALDKGARMLGFGYPGGAILEKMAQKSVDNNFTLPTPLVGQEKRQMFSYSGIKTSLLRLIETNKKINKNFPEKNDTYNLAFAFQDAAFKHLTRVISYILKDQKIENTSLLLGGGVAANVEIRKRIRKVCRINKIKLLTPYTKRLYGDNAAMIGICAYLKYKDSYLDSGEFYNYSKIDREPRMLITNQS